MTDVTAAPVAIPHVIRGEVVRGSDHEHPGAAGSRFATPAIDLDALVWPRTEPLPAAEVPIAEIIDILVATGDRLRDDPDGLVQEALEALVLTSPYDRRILENSYEDLGWSLKPDILRAIVDQEVGGPEVLDSWRRVDAPTGGGFVKAYPTRIIHVLAGNAPGVATLSVARGALSKGVHLFKMPSNDLLTATAVLRTLAAVAPGHPLVRSFSAVYWRGGDTEVESVLFRPQFFDKLVAWGGESAIRNAARYLGPGFELISFDPKNSISMIGREVFESDAVLDEVVELAASDSVMFNQEACTSSRFQFIEGDIDDVDRYCQKLAEALGKERRFTSAVVPPLPLDIREQVNSLRALEPIYRIFGAPDGSGLVIRSDEPVDFFPSNKTVNVVHVASLDDALRHVNVSTQSVGMYPAARRTAMRDRLASAGVQRVTHIGGACRMILGFPHDGFYPLHRFVRWVNDEEQ